MAFTTWTALKTEMLNDLATGKWKVKRYRVDETDIEYATFDEFRGALEYVERRAAVESGGFSGRTYARQGGRG